MDDGFAHLAAALHEHSSQITEAMTKSLRLDIGEILDDYSLKPNTYDEPIPQDAWSVCRQLTLGETDTHLTFTIPAGNPKDGTHSHGSSGIHSHGSTSGGAHVHTNEGPHVHDVLIPEKMRWVKPGDRVLIAWVGREAVVIDIILPATVLGGR
ncbi:MAG: hypothetical protein IJT94_12695 [Oscillibacter sp.]|nr:hypothetical protein [Oscillibacter sp.]